MARPAPRRNALAGHDVVTVQQQGWTGLKNGELLAAAESAGFELFILADKNLRYQQNLQGRRLAILVLPTTSWRVIQKNLAIVIPAVDQLRPGHFIELAFD